MADSRCPCMGSSLDRLLRPVVMAVLAGQADGLHGYRIAQRLAEAALFSRRPPDNTGLYRLLKAMEEEGYLTSAWDVEGSGPAKRIYVLTETGQDCLERWVETLDAYCRDLRQTVSFIRHRARQPVRGR